MFQASFCLRHMVSSGSLSYASGELNRMLDMKTRRAPMEHGQLKQFLIENVGPILEGTSLDKRGDTKAMKRKLGQLVRDAAFSASVVNANPESKFVRTLVECITHDSTRMHFLPQLSPAQSSKTIEFLCKVGVRDPLVYPPLVSKLDFHNLKEIARVTFAFAEAQLHEQNINVVVPLYCGETWELVYDVPTGAPRKKENAGCNVYEAVRVLRALSKSTRAIVEKDRQGHGSRAEAASVGAIPFESIRQLRDRLLLFLFENEGVMRGAHWINTARALVHFPEEMQVVGEELLHTRGERTTIAGEMETVTGAVRRYSSHTRTPVYCRDIALLCVQKIFDRAEGRWQQQSQHAPPSQPRETSITADRHHHDNDDKGAENDAGAPFDLTSLDLVKLLPLLRQVPCTEEVRSRRFRLVLGSINGNLASMQFGGLVLLIHNLRQIEGSQDFTADTVQRIAVEAGNRLGSAPPGEIASQFPMSRIVQFAAQLNAFRVKQCPGFVKFIEEGTAYLPPLMNPDTAATLLNALTSVTGKGGAAVSNDTKRAVLGIVRNMARYADKKSRVDGSQREVEDSLLFQYPLPCIRVLRAMVLLDVLPTADIVYAVFGARGNAQVSTHLAHSGAILVFDLSRSLAHLCRQARAASTGSAPPGKEAIAPTAASTALGVGGGRQGVASSPALVETPESIEQLLWSRGVVSTLFPLMEHHTTALSRGFTRAPGRSIPPSSYVPLCWRSSMESAAVYVDVTMDAAKDFTRMATRVRELHASTKPVLQAMLGIMATQCANLREGSRSPQELRQTFSKQHFSANAVIHPFSFILVWEYILYQAAWEARRVLTTTTTTTSGGSQPADRERLLVLAKELIALREEYDSFLNTPLGHSARKDLQRCTPLEVLALAFPATGANSVITTGSPSVAREPLLRKEDVLEITTHLPFAISLVLEPGPVNELFSEKCVPLILQADA